MGCLWGFRVAAPSLIDARLIRVYCVQHQRKKKLTDIGFRYGISKDWEIKFRTVSTWTLDDTGAPSFVNQLVTKVYPHPNVHKSNTTEFSTIGIYHQQRNLPIGLCFFTNGYMENIPSLPD